MMYMVKMDAIVYNNCCKNEKDPVFLQNKETLTLKKRDTGPRKEAFYFLGRLGFSRITKGE